MFISQVKEAKKSTLFLPQRCILPAVLEVFFGFDQLQRFLSYFLILDRVIHIVHALKDIVADQGGVLFRKADPKTAFETFNAGQSQSVHP